MSGNAMRCVAKPTFLALHVFPYTNPWCLKMCRQQSAILPLADARIKRRKNFGSKLLRFMIDSGLLGTWKLPNQRDSSWYWTGACQRASYGVR